MATGNFFNVNAHQVFALTDFDPQDADTLVEELREFFIDKGYEHLWKHDPYTQKTFGAESIASLELSNFFQVKTPLGWIGVSASIQIEVYLRFGYYQGANLDWVLNYKPNPDLDDCFVDEAPSKKQLADDISAQLWNDNDLEEMVLQKYAQRIAERMHRWFMLKADTLVNKTEKLMGVVAEPLRVVGTASNGETFYQKT